MRNLFSHSSGVQKRKKERKKGRKKEKERKTRYWEGHTSFGDCSVEHSLSLPASGGSGVPWLVATSLQSVPLWALGLSLVCFWQISLFLQESQTHYIGAHTSLIQLLLYLWLQRLYFQVRSPSQILGGHVFWGHLSPFPDGSVVKKVPANAGDASLIPESGRSPREGNGNLLQYSCKWNPMDRRAWSAPAHGVAKSQTRLSD